MKVKVLSEFVLVIAVMLIFAAAAGAQNLVVNGSFEADPFPGEVGYFPIEQLECTGWTKGGDGRWGINRSADPWFISSMNAPDGNQVLFVQKNTGTDGATVSQTIAGMEDGHRYVLSFYLNVRLGSATRPDLMDIWVTLGDVEMMPLTRFQYNSTEYYYLSFPFVYTEAEFGEPVLTFHNSYEPGGDTSYTLDAVSIVPTTINANISGPSIAVIGQNVALTVVSDAIGETSYTWYKDGVELVGEAFNTLELINMSAEDAGVYSVTVTDSTGSLTVAFTLIVVEALPLGSQLGFLLVIIAASISGFVLLRRSEA